MGAFDSRRAAGRALAAALGEYAGSDAIVLGLSRGGIAVADEMARALHLPLDALVVHKIAEPTDRHLGLGAVAEPGHVVVHRPRMRALSLASAWLEEAVTEGIRDVERRGASYRGGRRRQHLAGRRVIVVDDAAGTGATLQAAIRSARAMGAHEIIVAVPVAPSAVVAALQRQATRVVCLATPADLIWQGIHYPPPGEVSDEEIRRLLDQARQAATTGEKAGPERGAGQGAVQMPRLLADAVTRLAAEDQSSTGTPGTGA